MWKAGYHYLWLQTCANEEKADKRKTKRKLSPLEIAFIDEPIRGSCTLFQLTSNCWKSSKLPTRRKLFKHWQYWSNNSLPPEENELFQGTTCTENGLFILYDFRIDSPNDMRASKSCHQGLNKLRTTIKFRAMWCRATVRKNNYF